MTGYSIKVEGLKELEQALLKEIPKEARKVLLGGLRDAAQPMLAMAKGYAKSTDASGALSESLALKTVSAKRTKHSASILLGPNRMSSTAKAMYLAYYNQDWDAANDGIRHGHLVEFGTKHSGADPFLRPALDAAGPFFAHGFAGATWKRLASKIKKRGRVK